MVPNPPPLSMKTKLTVVYVSSVFGLELWRAANGVLEFFALLGVAIAGMYATWRVIRGARRRAAGAAHAVEVVRRLPEWQEAVIARLDGIDARFEVIADAEHHRITDAIAGDPRSPISRRSGDG